MGFNTEKYLRKKKRRNNQEKREEEQKRKIEKLTKEISKK